MSVYEKQIHLSATYFEGITIHMNLHKLLQSVKNGKPVNANRLKDMLDKYEIELNELGLPSYMKRNTYLIEVTDQNLLSRLIERTAPSVSRPEAAQKGNSHDHITTNAYFVAKLCGDENSIFAIDCNKNYSTSKEGRDIVLIENNECFTFSKKFLSAMEIEGLTHNAVVVWHSGNAITHPSAIRYLDSFTSRILYCPDYDLAGIQIFETLQRTLGNRIKFVMPSNLADYASQTKKVKERKHLLDAITKARTLDFTPMVELLTKGRGILEQEIFLGNNDEEQFILN